MTSAKPLSDLVQAARARSVLCWLATVDAQGQPNVSPQEVWDFVEKETTEESQIQAARQTYGVTLEGFAPASKES